MLYTIVKNAALPSSLTSCPRDIEQIRHDQRAGPVHGRLRDHINNVAGSGHHQGLALLVSINYIPDDKRQSHLAG